MIRYAAAAVVVAWAAGVTSYVLADRLIPVKPATPEPAPLPPLVEATGRLEAIDGRSGRLTLLSGERPLTLRCDEGTTVFIGGRMGSVDELDEGQTVRVTYEPSHGTPLAEWVEVPKE